MILSCLRMHKGCVSSSRIAGFAVRAHDAATSGDSCIQHGLHDGALIEALRQPYAIALEIAARPIWLVRSTDPEVIFQQIGVPGRQARRAAMISGIRFSCSRPTAA